VCVRIEQAYHEANVHGNVGVLGQLDKQVPHACLGCTDGLRRSGLELAVTRHVQKRHVKMHMKKKEKRNQGCACVKRQTTTTTATAPQLCRCGWDGSSKRHAKQGPKIGGPWATH